MGLIVGESLVSEKVGEELLPIATLDALLHFHLGFLRALRERRNAQPQVEAVSDILVEHFSTENSSAAADAYVQFCSSKADANALYRSLLNDKPEFRKVMAEIASYPSYKERSLPDCLLLVTQRLTKYPVLLDSILKNTTEDGAGIEEVEGMQEARAAVGAFASRVDAGVDRAQLRRQWADISAALDSHSHTSLNEQPYSVSHLVQETRDPIYIGDLSLKRADGKGTDVKLIIFTDILVFLHQLGSKWHFCSQDHKSAVIPLSSLLLRDKAGSGSNLSLFLVVTSKPELYEITASRKSQRQELVWVLGKAAKNAPKIPPPRPSAEASTTIGSEREDLLEELFSHIGAKRMWEAEEDIGLTDYTKGRLSWYNRLRDLVMPIYTAAGTQNKRIVERVRERWDPSTLHPPRRAESDLSDRPSLLRRGRASLRSSLRRSQSSLSHSASRLLTVAESAITVAESAIHLSVPVVEGTVPDSPESD